MKLTGVVAAIIIAILFLAFIDLPVPGDVTIDRASSDWAVKIGILLGAAISGVLLDNIYAPGFSAAEMFAEHKKGTRLGCVIGGLASLPAGFFLGAMYGGTLGAGIASLIWEPLIPYGIGFVTMVSVVLISTIASLLGSIIGNSVESAGRRG